MAEGRPMGKTKVSLKQLMEAAEGNNGATARQLAESLGITRMTLYTYAKQWPEFGERIKVRTGTPVTVYREALETKLEYLYAQLELCQHRCKNALSIRHAGDCGNTIACKEAREKQEDSLLFLHGILEDLQARS